MKLINDDCMKALKEIPSQSVDLVIIDPPYEFVNGGQGHSEISGRTEKHKADLKMLSEGFDFKVFDELERVLKAWNIYVWCSKRQVQKLLNFFVERDCIIEILTWHKTNPIPTCNGCYLPDTEYCIFAKERGVQLYGTYETKKKWYVTECNVKDKEKYHHPTIKPLHIIKNLIINSSAEGGVVLDCFMGSGTTGVAATKLGRDFIGIEIDKGYYDTAVKRINGINEQLELDL